MKQEFFSFLKKIKSGNLTLFKLPYLTIKLERFINPSKSYYSSSEFNYKKLILSGAVIQHKDDFTLKFFNHFKFLNKKATDFTKLQVLSPCVTLSFFYGKKQNSFVKVNGLQILEKEFQKIENNKELEWLQLFAETILSLKNASQQIALDKVNILEQLLSKLSFNNINKNYISMLIDLIKNNQFDIKYTETLIEIFKSP